MLWCEPGGSETLHLDTLAVFVSQLVGRGVAACVRAATVLPGLGRNSQFDLAPLLRAGAPGPEDGVVLLGAHRLPDRRLAELRRLAGRGPRRCIAFGSFESRQATIGTMAKLAYVFGREPDVIDLAREPGPLGGGDAPVFGVPCGSAGGARPRLLLIGPGLRDGVQASALVALALDRGFEVAVLTDGKSKDAWIAAEGNDLPVYHYSEILPGGLAERVEIAASFVPLRQSYRLQCLAANLAAAGGVLLDGSPGHGIARECDAFVRAPQDLLGLGPFLRTEILPNLAALSREARASAFAAQVGEAGLGWLPQEERTPRGGPAPAASRARVVFMPTNGVGLGHAQRCALIAGELDRSRAEPVFAAFPSCTGLVRRYGFDAMPLVPRSPLHAQRYANDLANYLRLRALCDGARALVFDGGYVFDSVYRTILEGGFGGVWIRRGLWQTGQDNGIALDREKAFTRVLVPSEAFDELNRPYSRGSHVVAVGPVVQRLALGPEGRHDLRAGLAARFGDFDRLVVSQLGAGVAADRGAQIQALCGMLERRSRLLHLVVVWPTAVLQPAWFAWSRSRVVKTHHAGLLAAAADLCISAAGYNCFHESLYNAVPSIFVPQMSAFMDDQRARALAARDRELAAAVEPHELATLERTIARQLDDGEAEATRARLAAWPLPPPGNAEAARIIEELIHGDTALDRDRVTDRPAGRR